MEFWADHVHEAGKHLSDWLLTPVTQPSNRGLTAGNFVIAGCQVSMASAINISAVPFPSVSPEMAVCKTRPTVLVTVGGCVYSLGKEYQCLPALDFGRANGFLAVTVLPPNTSRDTIPEHFAQDDVWNPDFTEGLIERHGRTSHLVLRDEYPKRTRTCESDIELPNGPYIVNCATGQLHRVFRHFEDPLHAFLGGGISYDSSSHQFSPMGTDRYLVPSKLYSEVEPSRPLQGLRFAVKDVIDLAGLKTSNGSRGWLKTYPPGEETAPFVRQLLDAGAVLVGKANCTQFCDGQSPSQRFEEVSPFNPRGDGYQNPSSSSSGSAVAAAGYDWIDFTIGTDTGGSIRHPAGVNGVYGIRPSLHAVSSRGMTASSFMDTVGVFARSADILEKAQKTMCSTNVEFKKPDPQAKYRLLYPVHSKKRNLDSQPKWFRHPAGERSKDFEQAGSIFEDVVGKLEKHLSCEREVFNIDELWRDTHPESMDADIVKATGHIYQKLVYRATAKDVIDPFIARHKALFDGRMPYLEPLFRLRNQYGSSVTDTEFLAAIKDFNSYKDWLLNVLLASASDEILILVFPQTWGMPNYRDESVPTPEKPEDAFWQAFSCYSISYVSGCPDITVPVGQVPYHSRITDREEWLPVSLSVLSRPGNDFILTGLLKELEDAGTLKPVQTGRMAYDIGNQQESKTSISITYCDSSIDIADGGC